MSKVVTIPKDRNPFIVIVNGVKYSYQAGQEVDVPDAVADVIEKYENAKPKPDPNAGGGSASVIEPITITENGTYEAPNSVDGYNPIMVNVGGNSSEEWIGDGNTHIWITLPEGRTSPMLGVCPNGTVTVDWGDGTTPDVLTGTITTSVKWTPTHNYAKPGDYVITLTVDGEMGFYGSSSPDSYSAILRYSSSGDTRNKVYQNAVRRLEIGNGVTSIGSNVFNSCYSLASINIPDGVTSIGGDAFTNCYSLTSIGIPGSVTSIGNSAFYKCYNLTSINIPDGVASIGNSAFSDCSNLTSIGIPGSVTSIGSGAFSNCYNLTSTNIPDGVASIGNSAFYNCYNLVSVAVGNSVTSIGSGAFANCGSMVFYDFTNHTAVPTLPNTNAFTKIPADCEIRVPAALYDEWVAATNWSTYASKIVAV